MSSDTLDLIVKVLAVVVPAGIALTIQRTTGAGARRTRLKTDAEILSMLTPGSPTHDTMSEIVRRQIDQLATFERGQRQIGVAIAASIAAGLNGLLTYALASAGGLLWGAAIFTGILTGACIYGVYESTARVERDAKGNAVRPAKADRAGPAKDTRTAQS